MKFSGSIGIILALACLRSAGAQNIDTVWACRDTNVEVLYIRNYFSDTFPDNRGMLWSSPCFVHMVDTGDAWDGNYVNFDYEFTNDSAYFMDTVITVDTTSDTIIDTIYKSCGPRPGYAGFKVFWDYGRASFWVSDHDSMILWHKGPLSGHKVMMVWAQGSAGCGTPINYEYFGQFSSSTTWTRESFPWPAKRGNSASNPDPDSPFVADGLFELRFLIYDDSTVTTSPTSAKGNLKVDNIYFLGLPPHPPVILSQPQSQTVDTGSSVTFAVSAYGASPRLMTYLWLKDNIPLDTVSSKDSRIYTIASATLSDAGSYRVVVTNSNGSDTSNAAILTVNVKAKEEKKKCGCGSGTGLAIIPPLFYKAMAHRKRKKKSPKT
jgi:hypothetical protein